MKFTQAPSTSPLLVRGLFLSLLAATSLAAQSAWQIMPTPSARAVAAMCYDPNSDSLLMVGGTADLDRGDTWSWRGTTASWSLLRQDSLPTARRGSAVVFDEAIGAALLFGGADNLVGRRNQTFLWSGSAWNLVVTGGNPAARSYHGLTYDPARGRAVLFGGEGADNTTWEWNGNDWLAVPAATAPVARYGHGMTFDGNMAQTLLFGGFAPSTGFRNDTWTWNGTAWTPRASPANPAPRSFTSMAHDPLRGRTVLFGGRSDTAPFGDTWEWNGQAWTQVVPIGGSPAPRFGHSMAFDAARGRVVLIGGTEELGNLPQDFWSDVWEWDGAAWTRVATGLPRERAGAAMTFHADSTPGQRGLLLFGGAAANGLVLPNSTQIWNGSTWTRPVLTSQPAPRSSPALAYDPTADRTVLFGGFDPNLGLFGDTWSWDGVAWSQAAAAGGPSARERHAMAFVPSPSGGQVLLFGGRAGPFQNDLWSWNGSGWTNITPAGPGPSPRMDHAMAYDPVNGRLVLFGGNDGNLRNDTWTWQQSTGWTQLSPSLRPLERSRHRMVFDASRGVVILHGGINNSALLDTWELRGAVWVLCSQIQPPPARYDHVLAYDPDRQRPFLFGGDVAGGDFWHAFNPNPSTFTAIEGTTGCAIPAASIPVLALTNGVDDDLPWLGGSLRVSMSSTPASSFFGLLLVGLGPSIAVPLPWPGCTLYTDFAIAPIQVGASPYNFVVGPIPWQATLLGIELVCQGAVPIGSDVLLTRGHRAVIGRRH